MIWVYSFCLPIFATLMGILIIPPLVFPVKELSPQVRKRLSREQQEDDAISVLEQRFVNDEITMEQLAEETEYILKGESAEQRRLRQEGPLLGRPAILTRGVEVEFFPPPSDAGDVVRSYSYPAAPGWPEVDPPHPVRMSSDGHTLCTKGQSKHGVCGCPDCFGTEEFYEALEATA